MNERPKLTRSGYRRIITIYLFMLVTALIFFAAAGRTDLPRAWTYFGLNFAAMSLIFLILMIRFPEMAEVVNARGEIKMPIFWDKLFTIGYTLCVLVLQPVIAGLDVGRYHWSELDLWWLAPGIVLFLVSLFISEWALLENKFFETGVRVQKERGQTVVSTGPYAVVRHPGYAAFIMLYSAFPLIVGSVYALYLSLVMALLFVVRTALEDITLQKELPGYAAYTKRTKYRLVPLLW
jgi:protein-S-isoprenylcysteine O-methyltransferase Ste14